MVLISCHSCVTEAVTLQPIHTLTLPQSTVRGSCCYLVEAFEKLWIKMIQTLCLLCPEVSRPVGGCDGRKQSCDPGSGVSLQTIVSIFNLFA